MPTVEVEQRAGRERRDGDEPEDEKIVEPLHFRLLGRMVHGREQARRANEREVPTASERDQRDVEMMQIDAGESDSAAQREQQEAGSDDRNVTDTRDHRS